MTLGRDLPLYWKVVLINGAVLTAATLVLVLSPVSVSRDTLRSEVLVLATGLVVMLVLNAVLLRASLAPLDRVIREMATVNPWGPGTRLEEPPSNPGTRLVRGFNAMLDRLEEERRQSSARALAAQEAERDRVARELHDEVGQRLTVVLLSLKRLEKQVPDGLAEELTLVREGARASLDDVRRVARDLRPGVLDDLGLVGALAALTHDFSTGTGTRVRRVVAPGLPELPRATELVVYRVAQEALTNAARHARAREVELALTRRADRLVLRVSDDGVGCRGLTPGAGIRGMEERALLVGARLDIGPAAGKGTVVQLAVPVGRG